MDSDSRGITASFDEQHTTTYFISTNFTSRYFMILLNDIIRFSGYLNIQIASFKTSIFNLFFYEVKIQNVK